MKNIPDRFKFIKEEILAAKIVDKEKHVLHHTVTTILVEVQTTNFNFRK